MVHDLQGFSIRFSPATLCARTETQWRRIIIKRTVHKRHAAYRIRGLYAYIKRVVDKIPLIRAVRRRRWRGYFLSGEKARWAVGRAGGNDDGR